MRQRIYSPIRAAIRSVFDDSRSGAAYPPLDRLDAAAAYSTRRLRTAYTGPALRVRRSLDNGEADIGFTGNNLDTAALMSFVGSQNLLSFSEEFENAAWTKNAVTVTANAAPAPDGTLTADRVVLTAGSLGRWVLQDAALVSGSVYAQSFYVRADDVQFVQLTLSTGFTGTTFINFDLSAGTIVGSGTLPGSIEPAGGGWYRITATGTASVTGPGRMILAAIPDASSSRLAGFTAVGTEGFFVWGAQLNAGALQPYSPTSRRNLLTFSEAFDNAAWTKTRVSVEPNVIAAPDGTLTADKVVDSETTSSTHVASQSVGTIATNEIFTLSGYTKQGDRNAGFIVFGTVGGSRLEIRINFTTEVMYPVASPGVWELIASGSVALPNGWYRIWATGRYIGAGQTASVGVYSGNDSNSGISYAGIIGAGTYYWGVQVDRGSVLTDYQRVDAAWSATRDGNGFVPTWYDQSDNARNLTQATAANQPQIVNAGVVVTDSGRPAISFDGVNDVLSSAAFMNAAVGNSALTFVSVTGGTNGNFGWSGTAANGGAGTPRLYFQRVRFAYNNLDAPLFTAITGTQVLTMRHDGVTTTNAWRNGTSMGSATEPVVASFGGGGHLSVPFFSGTTAQAGFASEAILFASALSTQERQTLEQNQGSYFGVTVA